MSNTSITNRPPPNSSYLKAQRRSRNEVSRWAHLALLFVFASAVGCTGTQRTTIGALSSDDQSNVQCEQRMPPLHPADAPELSRTETDILCDCVWDRLGAWERKVAGAFAKNRELEISPIHRRAFPTRFDQIVGECRVQGGSK
ncbi:MAG: hypothetical protein ACI8TX_000109 [Hyphomicrobiaceae bacterium]|jgi:hypothetical protein